MAEEEDAEATMSAECRVEALPLSGADISVDGLRLRLDIRIVPRSKDADASADTNAMLRVVTARFSKPSTIPAYQWAAAMVGVGTLLIAVTVWIAGIGEAPTPRESVQISTSAASAAPAAPVEVERPAAASPVIPATSTLPATPEATALPLPLAPQVEPVPAKPAPAAPPRIQRAGAEAAPPQRPEPRRRATPRAEPSAVAAVPPAPAVPATPVPQPLAQRPAARADMLDLFGDTK